MRIDVKKYLFVGYKDQRDLFFKRAQELGMIHFIEKQEVRTALPPQEMHDFMAALKILRGVPSLPAIEVQEWALADGFVHKILHLKESIEQLAEQQRLLHLESGRVAIFGDFSWEELHAIEKESQRLVQFYFAKSGALNIQELPLEVIYIGSDHELDYFIALNKEPRQYPKMGEMRIEHSITVVRELQQKVASEWHAKEQQLKSYAVYNQFLHQAFLHKLNKYHLQQAKGGVQFLLEDQLFAIEGWIPVNQQKALNDLVQEGVLHIEEIAVEPEDRVPTYLENQGLAKVGEDLVHLYDTPSSTDKDPSLFVLLFFSIFFALIIGDAGYGLIFFLAALYVRFRYSLKGLSRRISTLVLILGATTFVWGILSHSFFGLSMAPEHPLRQFSFMQYVVQKKAAYHIAHQDAVFQEWVEKFPQLRSIKNPLSFLKEGKGIYEKFADNVLFELALFIGVVHICISLLRNLYRNKVGIGWLLFIIGGYLYFPSYLQATSLVHYLFGMSQEWSRQMGFYLMASGMGLATFMALLKSPLSGFLEPMFGIQIFSDVMSYLRLYALGLSGAMMSLVINDFAAAALFPFGLLIAIFGHSLNILLSIMSGLIHGLRLNYLEWYHYSFEGDGKRFHPLSILTGD